MAWLVRPSGRSRPSRGHRRAAASTRSSISLDTGSSLNARTARRLSTASYTSTSSRPLAQRQPPLYRLQHAQEATDDPDRTSIRGRRQRCSWARRYDRPPPAPRCGGPGSSVIGRFMERAPQRHWCGPRSGRRWASRGRRRCRAESARHQAGQVRPPPRQGSLAADDVPGPCSSTSVRGRSPNEQAASAWRSCPSTPPARARPGKGQADWTML